MQTKYKRNCINRKCGYRKLNASSAYSYLSWKRPQAQKVKHLPFCVCAVFIAECNHKKRENLSVVAKENISFCIQHSNGIKIIHSFFASHRAIDSFWRRLTMMIKYYFYTCENINFLTVLLCRQSNQMLILSSSSFRSDVHFHWPEMTVAEVNCKKKLIKLKKTLPSNTNFNVNIKPYKAFRNCVCISVVNIEHIQYISYWRRWWCWWDYIYVFLYYTVCSILFS